MGLQVMLFAVCSSICLASCKITRLVDAKNICGLKIHKISSQTLAEIFDVAYPEIYKPFYISQLESDSSVYFDRTLQFSYAMLVDISINDKGNQLLKDHLEDPNSIIECLFRDQIGKTVDEVMPLLLTVFTRDEVTKIRDVLRQENKYWGIEFDINQYQVRKYPLYMSADTVYSTNR